MMDIVRAVITQIAEGAIKRFSGGGRTNETFTDREYFQHYGFTSRPKAGAEGLAIIRGNCVYLIASDDRRYRIELAEGEVALYSDEGDFIHFKRDNLLHVSTQGKLQADAGEEADITAPVVKVTASTEADVTSPVIKATASTSCTIVSPAIELTGAVHVTGGIVVTQGISASGAIASSGAITAASVAATGAITGATIIDVSGNTNHHSHG